MSEFSAVITSSYGSYYIDSIDDFQVSSNAEMTTQPMADGSVVGDHIIDQPCTITLSGIFSMNGSSPVKNLGSLQKQYEKLKSDAVLCTVAKVKNDTNEFRFIKRQNMILTGITWTERINSVSFAFTFSQALISDVVQEVVSTSVPNLPDIYAPRTLTCEGTLISEEELYKKIIEALIDSKIVDKEFLEQVSTTLELAGLGLLAAAIVFEIAMAGATAAGATTMAAAATAAAVSSTGIGAIIVAGAVVAAAIGKIVYDAIQAGKLKYKAFKADFDTYEEQRAENLRFAAMMDAIYEQVAKINVWLKVYGFSEDVSQEVMINVGGTYYIFRLEKKSTGNYHASILDFNENVVKSGVITCRDLDGCNAGNAFATIDVGDEEHFIYFVGDASSLTSVQLLVAQIDPSEFTNELTALIESAILE